MLFFPAAYAFIRNNDNELEPTTIKTYFWNLKKLEYFRPGLQCEEIDKAFIHSYKAHLQEQGNKPATVNKALSVFRIFLNKLIANGFKMDNPFAGFRIGRVYSRRGFLTIRELRNLFWNYTDSKNILDSRESEAMRVFLFSCFTGLRYSDLKSLDAMEIADWKIRKQTHKTGIKDMSDEELRSVVTRLQLEQQYRQLRPEQVSAGKRFADKVMKDVVAPAATEVGKNVLKDYMTNAIKKASADAAKKKTT